MVKVARRQPRPKDIRSLSVRGFSILGSTHRQEQIAAIVLHYSDVDVIRPEPVDQQRHRLIARGQGILQATGSFESVLEVCKPNCVFQVVRADFIAF